MLQLLCSQARRKLEEERPKNFLPNLETELFTHSVLKTASHVFLQRQYPRLDHRVDVLERGERAPERGRLQRGNAAVAALGVGQLLGQLLLGSLVRRRGRGRRLQMERRGHLAQHVVHRRVDPVAVDGVVGQRPDRRR